MGPNGGESGQVDANGYYYLNILGDAEHKLSAVLQVGRWDGPQGVWWCLVLACSFLSYPR